MKSPGRSRDPKAKSSGYSYAAIGLLKDNLQSVLNKKMTESGKAPMDGRLAADELSVTAAAMASAAAAAAAAPGALKSPAGVGSKADITSVTQRTGLSKENALLRAELEVLRQQNLELSSRLKTTEGKLIGQNTVAAASKARGWGDAVGVAGAAAGAAAAAGGGAGVLQEVEAMRVAVDRSEGAKAQAVADLELALARLELARMSLETLLLSPDEVEGLALNCCWLARYWDMAASFGLFPEVAGPLAAHWRALAPPPSAMVEAARSMAQVVSRRAVEGQQQQDVSASTGAGSGSGSGLGGHVDVAGGGGRGDGDHAGSSGQQQHQYQSWWGSQRRQQQQGEAPDLQQQQQPSAMDVVSVELGLRQLHELGVEGAVMTALAEQARARRAMVQLPQAGSGPQGLMPVALGPEESKEVRFQAARLAYLWGRAAASGVELPLSAERAEYWAWRLERGQPSLRDFADLRHGYQELRLRGVEQQLWELRRGQAAAAATAAAAAVAAAADAQDGDAGPLSEGVTALTAAALAGMGRPTRSQQEGTSPLHTGTSTSSSKRDY